VSRAIRHAFVVRDPVTVPPFDVPAGDTWLVDRTVRARARDELVAAGLTVEEIASVADAEAAVATAGAAAIVVLDSVAFSRPVLRRLLAAFASSEAPALVAALPAAVSTRQLSHIDGLTPVTVSGTEAFTAPLWALAPGGRTAAAEPALLPFKEHVLDLPMPIGMLGMPSSPLGLTDAWMCRIDHWAHVLRSNLAAIKGHWAERWSQPGGRLWMIWRALVVGFPWRRGRLTAALNQIHRGAKVHYRAHVELSVIEEGAEISPGAIVKSSWIGKGAKIGDGAVVVGSVVGPGASVSATSSILGCVLFPQAFAAQERMQISVLGEGAVAFTGSYFYDLNFDRNVRVLHRGRVVDAGDRFLSVCMGPWARIGGGVWVAAGREIPAGALLIQDQRGVLTRTADEMREQMMAVTDTGAMAVGPIPSNRPAATPALPPGNGVDHGD